MRAGWESDRTFSEPCRNLPSKPDMYLIGRWSELAQLINPAFQPGSSMWKVQGGFHFGFLHGKQTMQQSQTQRLLKRYWCGNLIGASSEPDKKIFENPSLNFLNLLRETPALRHISSRVAEALYVIVEPTRSSTTGLHRLCQRLVAACVTWSFMWLTFSLPCIHILETSRSSDSVLLLHIAEDVFHANPVQEGLHLHQGCDLWMAPACRKAEREEFGIVVSRKASKSDANIYKYTNTIYKQPSTFLTNRVLMCIYHSMLQLQVALKAKAWIEAPLVQPRWTRAR